MRISSILLLLVTSVSAAALPVITRDDYSEFNITDFAIASVSGTDQTSYNATVVYLGNGSGSNCNLTEDSDPRYINRGYCDNSAAPAAPEIEGFNSANCETFGISWSLAPACPSGFHLRVSSFPFFGGGTTYNGDKIIPIDQFACLRPIEDDPSSDGQVYVGPSSFTIPAQPA